MDGHEISIGDVYNLIRDTRDDVIAMKERLQVVLDESKDHDTRLRVVEDSLAEVRHLSDKKDDLKSIREDIKGVNKDISDLSKKVYAYAGGATVVGALAGTVIQLIVGK